MSASAPFLLFFLLSCSSRCCSRLCSRSAIQSASDLTLRPLLGCALLSAPVALERLRGAAALRPFSVCARCSRFLSSMPSDAVPGVFASTGDGDGERDLARFADGVVGDAAAAAAAAAVVGGLRRLVLELDDMPTDVIFMLRVEHVSRSGVGDVRTDSLVLDADERVRERVSDARCSTAAAGAAAASLGVPLVCDEIVRRRVRTRRFDDTLLDTVDARLLASLLSGDCPKMWLSDVVGMNRAIRALLTFVLSSVAFFCVAPFSHSTVAMSVIGF